LYARVLPERRPDRVFPTFAAESGQATLRLDSTRSVEISAPLDPANLADPAFAGAFREALDRDPGPYAAYGYEAMQLVLDAIGSAEDSEDGFRAEVVDGIHGAERPDSILGAYSITDDGDSTLCGVQAYELTAGGRLLPRKPTCPAG